jgi:hypothetical protein
MDLANFNYQKCLDSPSSPLIAQTTNYILNTPKTNKSIHDSKSPLRRLKLKKSKRRECTPAYSPKFFEEKNEKNLLHNYANTDIKKKDNLFFKEKREQLEFKENEHRVNQRLTFEDVNTNNFLLNNNNCNDVENPPKKKFISLFEDSLNDVNENYYGILCSQITPDTIFKTFFNNEEEKAKKQNRIFSKEESEKETLSAINYILMNLKNKNFEQLFQMVIYK